MNGLSLDGVMQSPARPDEDTSGGFALGGWGIPYGDEEMVRQLGEKLPKLTGGNHAWLFGRRTYEDLLAAWNDRGGPFKESLNNSHKYVASRNPAARLEWPNSTLLHGDVPSAVADLKRTSRTNHVIMGSGVLISSLLAADLIDQYLLTIAPVVLGVGKRMFPDGVHRRLRLAEVDSTSKGVIVAIYEA